jgi:glycosyltransferase involved in cell wall biosynthesis
LSVTRSLDVVIPVLNEEEDLPSSVQTLHEHLSRHFDDYEWWIVIADNGSTDLTPEVARRLSGQAARVRYIRLEQRGRGRALGKAWLESDADIVGYMDVDLSTDLSALRDLVAAVDVEGYDIAIGSRLKEGAQVVGRSFKREFISRAYSLLFRAMFLAGFVDAQCGFKVLRARAAHELVPLLEDKGWFFDTELLLVASRLGYRIKEVPVRWTDDPDSRVKIVSTAYEDFKGLLRLRFGGLKRASELASKRGPAA